MGDEIFDKIAKSKKTYVKREIKEIPIVKETIKPKADYKEVLAKIKNKIKQSAIIERDFVTFTPKCKECYDNYGFLNKCICDKTR